MHATNTRWKNKLATFCVALAATISAHAGQPENPILTHGIAGVTLGMTLQSLRHSSIIKDLECDGGAMQGPDGLLSDNGCYFEFKHNPRLGTRAIQPGMTMVYIRKNKVVGIMAYIPLSEADKKLAVKSLLSDIAGPWDDKSEMSDRETIFKNKATFYLAGQPQRSVATVAFRVKRMLDGNSVVLTLGEPDLVVAVSGHFPGL